MAYVVPDGWDDLGMNWSNPDPSDGKYICAIFHALIERWSVLSYGEAEQIISDPYGFSTGRIFEFGNYRAVWANRIVIDVLRLITSDMAPTYRYVVLNPDSSKAYDFPVVRADEVLGIDSNLLALTISTGDLVSSDASVAFLKACYYFLNQLTMVAKPMVIKHDRLSGNYGTTPAPNDSTGWAAFLSKCISRATTTAYEWKDVRSYLIASPYYSMNANINVECVNDYQIAHNLHAEYKAYKNRADATYCYFWDFLELGETEGFIKVAELPEGGENIILGPTSVVSPTSWSNWPINGTNPSRTKTTYGGELKNFVLDFNVSGGFKFK